MKNEFVLAFNEVIEEKQLSREIILKALESAMVSAYRRAINASNAQHVEAKVDPETGKVAIYAEKEVVETVANLHTEVSLLDAKRYNPDAEIGMMAVVDSTPTDFGRVAAQTARQVIQQRIRDAERQSQLDHYQKQLGEIISGIVQNVNNQGLTIGLEMRAEGFISRKDMIPGERFKLHDRVRALVADVKDNQRGPQIILSRTHRDFLRRLLENEVPEIYHGIVEIRSIAREPGERAKVAVSATQSGIDPVGACVGVRGVRIQAIVRELHNEKIDVIEWNNDPTIFISKAISPARVTGVFLSEKAGAKTATVVVSEDQLSLAIGRDGQNARLAAKLTSWRIDIKSIPEAAADILQKLRIDSSYEAFVAAESDNFSQIDGLLAKKSEGRPLTPEEYDQLTRFIIRVEKRSLASNEAEKASKDQLARLEVQKALPAHLFEQDILDSGLPEHVSYILQEAGYTSVGELVTQIRYQPDSVLRLQGIGPKAMAEITRLMENVEKILAEANAPQVEEQPVAEFIQEIPTAETEQPVIIETSSTADQPVETEEPKPVTSTLLAEVQQEQAAISDDTADSKTGETSETDDIKEDMAFDELLVAFKTDQPETEEFEDDDSDKSSKKKKKNKHVEIVYDPDRDVTTVRKKHKRSAGDWDWEG